MDQQDVLIRVAQYLNTSRKVVTLSKVVSETSLDQAQAETALELLASKGLASKRTIEDFDESCYQANEHTAEFCDKVSSRSPEGKDRGALKEASGKDEGARAKTSQRSPVSLEEFLMGEKAPAGVIEEYNRLVKERNYYKKRSSVWEKHIGKMVNDITKELSS